MNADPREGLDRMRGLVAGLGGQLRAAPASPGLEEAAAGGPVREVLLCGMGGSAIAGDLLAALCEGGRLSVHRDYGLPGWVGPDTFVVLSSYSGGTEEVLAAADAAAALGCPTVRVTSGGELAARDLDGPVVELPGGLPPRASLGHGLGVLATLLGRRGLLPGAATGLGEAADLLDRRAETLLADGGPPDEMAAGIGERSLVIHTTSPRVHAVGRRWRAQIEENAKRPARCGEYPELDHNEIEGWSRDVGAALLTLRGADEDPRTTRRVAATTPLLKAAFPVRAEVRPEGESPLARLLSLVQFGDALSVALAARAGIDPVPVARIEEMKRRLAEGD